MSNSLGLLEQDKNNFFAFSRYELGTKAHISIKSIDWNLDGSKLLNIHFTAKHTSGIKTLDGAREVMLKTIPLLSSIISQNSDIQPYLTIKPLPIKNIQLDLYFDQSEPDTRLSPFKALFDGTAITYFHDEVTSSPETLEEALKENVIYLKKVEESYEAKDFFIGEICKKLQSDMQLKIMSSFFSTYYPDIHQVSLEALFKKNMRTPDQARPYIVQAISIVLDYLNENPRIQPYLAEKPFPSNRIILELHFEDPRAPYEYGICSVSFFNNVLHYSYLEQREPPFKETFEEAKQKLMGKKA